MPAMSEEESRVLAAVEGLHASLRVELDNAVKHLGDHPALHGLIAWAQDFDAALGHGVTYAEWLERFGRVGLKTVQRPVVERDFYDYSETRRPHPRGVTLTEAQQAAVDMLARDATEIVPGPKDNFPHAMHLVEVPRSPFADLDVRALIGYAGTGKTTTVGALLDAFHTRHVPIALVAPTGKAALRLREVTGRADASTIHSFIYKSEEDPTTGDVIFKRKERGLLAAVKVVICDEASMVTADVFADLKAVCGLMGARLILVGDGFQLPPVAPPGAPPFSALEQADMPTARLTEVLRQAANNPIIAASMAVREGRPWAGIKRLEKVHANRGVEHAAGIHRAGGITICHRNGTRVRLNAQIRVYLGIVPDPNQIVQPSEPLLVRRNSGALGRFNGEIVKFGKWLELPGVPRDVRDRVTGATSTHHFGLAEIIGEGGRTQRAVLCHQELVGTTALKDYELARAIRGHWMDGDSGGDVIDTQEPRPIPYLSANLGYVCTAHSAQGSQWDEVFVVIEPSVRFGREDGRRWAYTAITRAAKVCSVLVGE